MTGSKSYSGDTTLSAGAVTINTTGFIWDGTGTLYFSGGNLTLTAQGRNVGNTLNNPILVTADSAITTTSSSGSTIELTLSNSISGNNGTLTIRHDGSGAGVFQVREYGSSF